MNFHELKIYIINLTDLSRDAMHIHVGMAIFMLIWLSWRWRGARLIAWLGAVVAGVSGEWLDHIALGGRNNSAIWLEHWKDLLSTILWPTILVLFIGLLPYVSRQRKDVTRMTADDKPDEGL